ncbi:unnamed protein product [Ceratitis capitata]|uniref:(Mediterranean fruit fly) hypothetical protein n=1 Tax=Ceratitis capitata TaxID=7213 RepID=A0A811V3C3_CERCA|nr:unnamed protein product [Ceratitis capitata]
MTNHFGCLMNYSIAQSSSVPLCNLMTLDVNGLLLLLQLTRVIDREIFHLLTIYMIFKCYQEIEAATKASDATTKRNDNNADIANCQNSSNN